MNIEKTLSVQKREGYGKGPSGRLRAQKLIPGVFYTPKGENISVQAPALPLQKIYEEMGHTTVFNLEIEENGQKTAYPVLIWTFTAWTLTRKSPLTYPWNLWVPRAA